MRVPLQFTLAQHLDSHRYEALYVNCKIDIAKVTTADHSAQLVVFKEGHICWFSYLFALQLFKLE